MEVVFSVKGTSVVREHVWLTSAQVTDKSRPPRSPSEMVQPQFKENTVVIIDTGKRLIRAGRGLNELLPAPTVVSGQRARTWQRA